MAVFPAQLRAYVGRARWIFAKTYAATWPHHYLVLGNEPAADFLALVLHVRNNGRPGKFYDRDITYYDEDGMTYWTMVPPVGHPKWYPPGKEDIVNRCPTAETYAERLKAGTLPGDARAGDR